MQNNIYIVESVHILERLKETPYPPKRVYVRGAAGAPHHKYVTIVGSRNCSQYAKQVVEEICAALEGQPITIISGLAQGVDAHAHTCALRHNLHTIAVLGCGLSDRIINSHSNYKLAHKILESGGALLSEYEANQTSRSWMFPARNRIMVGLSELVIVIEAKQKSGTRITARLATDYNRDLLVIPNSIYSSYSKGSNELIKQGAYMYTTPEDIFNLLKLDFEQKHISTYTPTDKEKIILELISSGQNKTQLILDACSDTFTPSEIIQILLNLEIEEVIRRVDGVYVMI